MLPEVFAALVAVACREWGQTLPKNSEQSLSSVPLEEADTGGMVTSSSNENLAGQDGDISKEDIGAAPMPIQKDGDELEFEAAYQLLSPDEKVALDQWWKWYPGRWSSPDDKNWQGYGASRTRLKAWQVALAGIIRDWIPREELRQKYTILKLLISDHSEEMSSSVDQPIDDDVSVGTPEVLNDSDDPSAFSDDSDSQQYSFRKRNKSYKPAGFDEEFSEDELTQPVAKGSRKSSRQVEQPRKKRDRPAPRDTRKGARQISIESLCQNAEVGFSKISLEDRILLISVLINSCVSTSGKIHSFIDESLEKITELKRERRQIVRERKELYVIFGLRPMRCIYKQRMSLQKGSAR